MNDLWFTESSTNLLHFCDSKDCLDGVSPSLLPVRSDSLDLEITVAPREVPSHPAWKETLWCSNTLGGKQEFPTLTGWDQAPYVPRGLVHYVMGLLVWIFRGSEVPDSFSVSLEGVDALEAS